MIIELNQNYLKISDQRDLLIKVQSPEVHLDYEVSTDTRVIIINDTTKDLHLKESGFVTGGAELLIAYLDLNQGKTFYEADIKADKDSSLKIISKYLCSDQKKADLKYTCLKERSSIDIDNSAIVLDDASLELSCTGIIDKGAKRAKNHQSSRCLTVGKPKTAKIEPILLIDEDDVEASHSLSSGTIDEDVLFYMNTKGIDYNAAMRLFISSYLTLDERLLKDYPSIQDEIRKKVEQCLM